MNYTIERLIRGDEDIIGYYQRALDRWEQILGTDSSTVEELARLIDSEQLQFENECGGRWLGQEVMAVTGIAQFYRTEDGFGGRLDAARRVYDAIQLSYCSLEVKGHADEVARSYLLDERHP